MGTYLIAFFLEAENSLSMTSSDDILFGFCTRVYTIFIICSNQAECEELQKRVEALGSENQTLREELQRLSEECDKLTSENDSIKVNFKTLVIHSWLVYLHMH